MKFANKLLDNITCI